MDQETKSLIRQQINRGHLRLNVPITFFMAGLPILLGFLSSFFFSWWVVILVAGASFYLGYRLAWWYWGIFVVKWRLKAFETVPKEHWLLLQEAAEKEKIVWPPFHEYEKYEQPNEEDAQRTVEILEHIVLLRKADQRQLEVNMPGKFVVRIKNRSVQFYAALMLAVFLFGLGCLLFSDMLIVGILVIGIALYSTFKMRQWLPFFFTPGTGLEIDENGITVVAPHPDTLAWKRIIQTTHNEEDQALSFLLNGPESGENREVNLQLSFYAIPDVGLFKKQLAMYQNKYERRIRYEEE